MSVTTLQRTPLYQEHIALGGKMVEFAGWEMPVQYRSGVLKEHAANRRGCSIFDCSHMGEFILEGDPVTSGLDRIVTQSVVDMPVKSCRYGMILNAEGGTIDDLIVYRLAPEKWMIVVNASNIEKDRRHFQANLLPAARLKDVSAETAKLDLQGPLSRDILSRLVPEVARLEYYTFDEFELLGERVIISRTGYTGELGYEIYYPWDKAVRVWGALLADQRVAPTGLGVRDVLRLEMCYPLYGHELTESISPLEAGLKTFVSMPKEFVGKAALVRLEQSGLLRKIVHFVSESRRAPRQGHQLYSTDGQLVGEVVSGTFSPALNAGIGIGFVKKEFTSIGKNIIFGDEKNRTGAGMVPRPFYKHGSLKS
ncbi:MAG: glycine cleavage system aminomethyltransferase GcvT [Candidatus Omnitrophica bacterium]|nr:glycine cleavage system aminomethyltransferase GcvT [Candidatus Omnitrophota bacterium]